jgi:hypothetical protein
MSERKKRDVASLTDDPFLIFYSKMRERRNA